MDIRVLRYFIAAAQSKSISAASKALYITQPTLTRQFKELEDELGQKLFVRSKNGIELTEKGELFYERALEILALVERMKSEVKSEEVLRGSVAIAAAETSSMAVVAQAMKHFGERCPQVSFNVYTATRIDALRLVDSFSYDFALLIKRPDPREYDMLPLNEICRWGVIFNKNDPLAGLPAVTAADLRGRHLIFPRTETDEKSFEGWLGVPMHDSGGSFSSCNMINNGIYMVKAGLGCLFSIDTIMYHVPPGFCFVPLSPAVTSTSVLVWKKGRSLSKIAALFLEELKRCLTAGSGNAA